MVQDDGKDASKHALSQKARLMQRFLKLRRVITERSVWGVMPQQESRPLGQLSIIVLPVEEVHT